MNHNRSKSEERKEKVGLKIDYYPMKLLGKGRNSRVCEGTFEGKRPVAVKRLDIDEIAYFESETEILCAAGADCHPNIIRYFCSEVKDEFRYIVLELCAATIADLVQNHEKTFKFGKVNRIELLRQSSEALNFLHKNNIVHRDVKPSNILLMLKGKEVIVKISDFGLGKRLPEGKDDYTNSGNASGTEGWKAPEVVKADKKERLTSKVDVWSFGNVIYYVLTGTHPKDAKWKTQEGLNLHLDSTYLHTPPISGDLVGIHGLVFTYMIQDKPKRRCPLSFVLRHPIFWNNDKIMKFFIGVRSLFKDERPEVKNTLQILECAADLVFAACCGHNWTDRISEHFKAQLYFLKNGQQVFYDGRSVIHLIRAMRDKYLHFKELSAEAKEEIGGEVNYVNYWLQKFPCLFQHTYRPFSRLRHLDNLREFYPTSLDFNETSEEFMWAGREIKYAEMMRDKETRLLHWTCPRRLENFARLGSSPAFNRWRQQL